MIDCVTRLQEILVPENKIKKQIHNNKKNREFHSPNLFSLFFSSNHSVC